MPKPQVSPPTPVNGSAAVPMAARRSDAAFSAIGSIGTMEGTASESLLRFSGKVGRCDGEILIDSGATSNFISEEFVLKNRMMTYGSKIILFLVVTRFGYPLRICVFQMPTNLFPSG